MYTKIFLVDNTIFINFGKINVTNVEIFFLKIFLKKVLPPIQF